MTSSSVSTTATQQKHQLSVELLNVRLREIEECLFGGHAPEQFGTLPLVTNPNLTSSSSVTPTNTGSNQQQPVNLLQCLSSIDQKLKSITIGKENFAQCYAELRKLDKWINAATTAATTSSGTKVDDDDNDDDKNLVTSTIITDAIGGGGDTDGLNDTNLMSKFEEILAFEDIIHTDAQQTELMQSLMPALDKPPLRQVSELQPTLDRLQWNLLRLQQDTNDLEDESIEMISQVDGWFRSMAQTLNQFNVDLIQLEQRKEEEKYA